MGPAVEKLFVVYQKWAYAGPNKIRSGEGMDWGRLPVVYEKMVVDNWMCREQMDHVFDA